MARRVSNAELAQYRTIPLVDSIRAACYKETMSPCGPVAQLGARMTGSHEVESSNLSRSTNNIFAFIQILDITTKYSLYK